MTSPDPQAQVRELRRQLQALLDAAHANERKLDRFDNLTVLRVMPETEAALASLAHRQMRLNAMIQDGQLWLGDDGESVAVALESQL